MPHTLRRLLTGNVVNICVVLLLALHTGLMGRVWLWNIFSVVPPIAFPVVLLLLIFWNLSTRNPWGILAIAIAAPLAWWHSDVALIDATPTPEGQQITVFNWNTEYWEMQDLPGFLAFLKNQRADVYQLQERVTTEEIPYTDAEVVQAAFPDYHLVEEGEFLTLSRFPVVHTMSGGSFLRTDIKTATGTVVRFYNVHTTPPLVPWLISRPLHFIGDIESRFAHRQKSFALLEQDAQASPVPYYISGDFNSTTAMGVMQPLLAATRDSLRSSPSLFPRTWGMHGLRMWRLDYNLLGGGLGTVSHDTIDALEWSDHSAQRVTVVIGG